MAIPAAIQVSSIAIWKAGSARAATGHPLTSRQRGEAAGGQVERAQAQQAPEQGRVPPGQHALRAAQLGHALQLARLQQLRHQAGRDGAARARAQQLYAPDLP